MSKALTEFAWQVWRVAFEFREQLKDTELGQFFWWVVAAWGQGCCPSC